MSEAASADPKKVQAEPSGIPVDQATRAAERIAELQVSAHLMNLETGLFCIFSGPGSPMPDPATGLPGVRITPPPGLAGRPEAVSISTFREDGWLNGTAALVRVTDGPAQILVTVYQARGGEAAPRLQVMRLNGEPSATAVPEARPAAKPVGPQVANPAEPTKPVATAEVVAHIQRMGDVGCKIGEWLGTKGSRQWVEGFGMAPANGIAPDDIEYQAVLGRNWLSPWVQGGKFCGSRGMALPLLGFKVRLRNDAAKAFTCSYAATFVDGTVSGPIEEGEACQAESLAALESFQITIKPRVANAPARTARSPATPSGNRLPGRKPAAKEPTRPVTKTLAGKGALVKASLAKAQPAKTQPAAAAAPMAPRTNAGATPAMKKAASPASSARAKPASRQPARSAPKTKA